MPQRNTERTFSVGVMKLEPEDLATIEEKGWDTVIFDHPNKRDTRVEVIELNREVETRHSGWRSEI
jgi:protein tyrosine phosphatase (PTP) superfamily phosphohydrolase (DUF442 family)